MKHKKVYYCIFGSGGIFLFAANVYFGNILIGILGIISCMVPIFILKKYL